MKSLQPTGNHNWYVRHDGVINGPYSTGLVMRYVLLGRITRKHELSTDRENWKKLSELPELIPEILQADSDDPYIKQRLMAAKRWADDRMIDVRKFDFHARLNRRHQNEESDQNSAYVGHSNLLRPILEQRQIRQRRNLLFSVFIVAGLMAAVFLTLTTFQPLPPDNIDCQAAAMPKVNWSNCQMEGVVYNHVNLENAVMKNMNLSGAQLANSNLRGVDLSYSIMVFIDLHGSDLSGANMKGVTLRGASLEAVKLQDADLSYTNLTGASMSGIDLTGTKLDNAKWRDGRVCASGSVGQCL